MHRLAVGLYAVFGTLAVVAGAAALVSPGFVIPASERSGLVTHLIREQAAGFVFIGLMSFWCLKHPDQRRPVHIGLLVFTGLFAAIHWLGYVQGGAGIWSPVINTVPFALFAVAMPGARGGAR